MSEVMLSVIIPMYKGKTYITETINSLLPISCAKELLIIDDGSPDDSGDFCRKQWVNCAEVRVIDKENGGIVSARNYGLAQATGTYVLFCDHDDIVFPKTIDLAITRANETDADAVIWSTVRYVGKDQFIPCDTVYQNTILDAAALRQVAIPDMLMNQDNHVMSYIGHLWAGVYRRKTLEMNQIRFRRFVDIEDDYLFVLDFFSCAHKVCFVTDVGYAWRYNICSETYKQKYIANYLQKSDALYQYIDAKLVPIAIAPDVQAQYGLYRKQDVLIRAIENGYTIQSSDPSERVQIRARFRADRAAFRQESIVPYEKRRKRIFVLLRRGLFSIACIYVYADSVYRKIRGKKICAMTSGKTKRLV